MQSSSLEQKETVVSPISPVTMRDLLVNDRAFENSKEEIATVFNGGKAQYGAMFDIRALPNNIIRIDSIAFHTLDERDECEVQIYTKAGSHEYFEEESSAWKRLISTVTECKGPGRKTTVTLRGDDIDSDDLRIGRSERRAFYVRVIDTQVIYSMVEKQNSPFKTDDHVQIFTGVSVGGFFKDFWSPRMLNVAVSYVVEKIYNGAVGIPDNSFGEEIGSDVCIKALDVMTADSVNKNYGIMFNIDSNTESTIKIFGLGFYVDSNAALINYDIYALHGGFEQGSATASLWTQIGSGDVENVSKGSMITISGADFTPIPMRKGETYGFYLTLKSENLRYHSTSVSLGETYLQNKHLRVSVGAGVSSVPLNEFTKFLSRRTFHGKVLYGVEEDCRPEVVVKYTFIVQYPREMDDDDMHDEINNIINDVARFLMTTDLHLKALTAAYDLELTSVFSKHDTSPPGKSFAVLRF